MKTRRGGNSVQLLESTKSDRMENFPNNDSQGKRGHLLKEMRIIPDQDFEKHGEKTEPREFQIGTAASRDGNEQQKNQACVEKMYGRGAIHRSPKGGGGAQNSTGGGEAPGKKKRKKDVKRETHTVLQTFRACRAEDHGRGTGGRKPHGKAGAKGLEEVMARRKGSK